MKPIKQPIRRTVLFCFAALVLGPAPRAIADAPSALAERDKACIACHDSPIAVRALGDGSSLPLFVESESYAASVHAARGCVGCHTDVDPAAHPSGRPIASRESYAAERSAPCRTCHPGPKTGTATVHEVLVTRAKAPPCAACHLPHGITRLGAWRSEVSVTRYCLSCHFGEIQVAFGDDETSIPPAGDATSGPSVHLDHECTDCHAGFSKADSPGAPLRQQARARRAAGGKLPGLPPRPVPGGGGERPRRARRQAGGPCADLHGLPRLARGEAEGRVRRPGRDTLPAVSRRGLRGLRRQRPRPGTRAPGAHRRPDLLGLSHRARGLEPRSVRTDDPRLPRLPRQDRGHPRPVAARGGSAPAIRLLPGLPRPGGATPRGPALLRQEPQAGGFRRGSAAARRSRAWPRASS